MSITMQLCISATEAPAVDAASGPAARTVEVCRGPDSYFAHGFQRPHSGIPACRGRPTAGMTSMFCLGERVGHRSRSGGPPPCSSLPRQCPCQAYQTRSHCFRTTGLSERRLESKKKIAAVPPKIGYAAALPVPRSTPVRRHSRPSSPEQSSTRRFAHDLPRITSGPSPPRSWTVRSFAFPSRSARACLCAAFEPYGPTPLAITEASAEIRGLHAAAPLHGERMCVPGGAGGHVPST